MPLGEEAQKELAEALRIFREDHIIKNLSEIKASLREKAAKIEEDTKPEPVEEPGEGDPPPAAAEPKETPKRRHPWWGEE